jgi:hypothetical protein
MKKFPICYVCAPIKDKIRRLTFKPNGMNLPNFVTFKVENQIPQFQLKDKDSFIFQVLLDPWASAATMLFDPDGNLIIGYQVQAKIQGDVCMIIDKPYLFKPGEYMLVIDPIEQKKNEV